MVAEVVAYCEANKISNKQRLKELGVSAWSNLKIRKTSRLLSEAYAVEQLFKQRDQFVGLVQRQIIFDKTMKRACVDHYNHPPRPSTTFEGMFILYNSEGRTTPSFKATAKVLKNIGE